ncbi:MAG: aspartyl protease family protein [Saprospiraceae bacterium]
MYRTRSYNSFILQLLMLLIFCVPNLLEAKKKSSMEVPFEMVNGMIVMKLEVNGEKGSFILDTGADAILVDGNPAENEGNGFSTLGGTVESGITQLKKLKMGSYIKYDVAAQVINLKTLEQNLGIDLYGIIGGGYFNPYSLEIDFTNSIVTLSNRSAYKKAVKEMSAVKFEMVDGIPVVPVTIGDRTFEFAMDSGASIHFVHSALLEEIEGIKKMDSSANVLSASHLSEKINRYEIAGFNLGEIHFEHQQCLHRNFDEVNKELTRPIAGILSLSSLAREKVIIDFKKKKMYF